MKGFIRVPTQHPGRAAVSDTFNPTLIAISAITQVGSYGPDKSRIVLKTLGNNHGDIVNDILIVNMKFNELEALLESQVQSDTVADQTTYQFKG